MKKENTHFLAFDCGATSCRGVLGTFADGQMTARVVCRFPNQTLELGGRYYWNVYGIYEHIVECLALLGREGVRLDSIGIDTWGVDFGLLGDDGTLLTLPRAYRDPYTKRVPERVFDIIPREELYTLTGIQTMEFNSVFQLYAMKETGDTAYRHARHLLFMPDLLSYMLTGRMVCEYTVASTSGLLNARTRQFETTLMERLGLKTDLLLPLVQPGTMVGTLRSSVARQTGVGEVPVVAVAGHDTASAVAAIAGDVDNAAYLSSGTWSLMGINLAEPVLTARAAVLNFTNEGGVGGTTRFLKNITGLWLVEQCRKVWKAQGRDYSYPEMTAMAERAEGYPGRIHPDDPRFANPADMDSEIRIALAESGYPAPQGDAEMLSCIYHSLAERYKEVLEMLQEFSPTPIGCLHVIGGGAANTLLNRWMEETLGIPVIAGPTEATAMGNLYVQSIAYSQSTHE